MRIALIGQAAFAEKSLELLRQRGDEVVHVFAARDSGGRPEPLKVLAESLGLPVSQPGSFRSEAMYERFRALDLDLIILAFVTLIVPERILYLPRHKAICFHPSLLPRHRGASGINWALIAGDRETGVTWFWPDAGLDTGPILVQKHVPIEPQDTVGSIYFNRLFPLGIEALGEALDLIARGNPPAIVQDESQASYEPPCRDEHAAVDFSQPAPVVHNLIRGCDPQPGAYAQLEGQRLRLFEPRLQEGAPQAAPGTIISPGTVISIDSDGMRLALRDAMLVVGRVRLEPEGKKLGALQLAQSGALRIGQILVNG